MKIIKLPKFVQARPKQCTPLKNSAINDPKTITLSTIQNHTKTCKIIPDHTMSNVMIFVSAPEYSVRAGLTKMSMDGENGSKRGNYVT